MIVAPDDLGDSGASQIGPARVTSDVDHEDANEVGDELAAAEGVVVGVDI